MEVIATGEVSEDQKIDKIVAVQEEIAEILFEMWLNAKKRAQDVQISE